MSQSKNSNLECVDSVDRNLFSLLLPYHLALDYTMSNTQITVKELLL